jgi:hypothetical protein
VAFPPDGKLVAVGIHETSDGGGYRPKGVRVAEVASGQEVFHFEGWIDFVAFAPDGRVLAAAGKKGLSVHDALTGEQLFRQPWPRGVESGRLVTPVNSFAFLPNGKAVVTGMQDGTILVWDLAPQTWPAPAAARDLGRKELEALWSDLTGDARTAQRAVRTLATAPGQAVPFLTDRLRPAVAADGQRVQQRIAALDSRQFAVRDAAAKELIQLGEQIEPALRAVLEGSPSLEKQQRIEKILAGLRSIPTTATLRTLRALQALERIGTPEARRVLRRLADGAPAARETREARAALERLERRPVVVP